MRASGSDIHHRRTEVVAFIRRSRYRSLCVNELIHECVDRGGTDGLVTAIEVLAQIDPKVVLSVAWDFFRRDIGRWRQLAKGSHTRYVVRDEVWHILLRSICQSADPKDALALLLVALAGGPDGIREGCAEAAGDLVAREPKVMRVVTTCLRELLDSPPSGSQPLSPTSRDAIRDVLADMGE